MSWVTAFLAFAAIVAFHEFGHFLFAKLFGMKVDVFSVGFGKRLIGLKWRETDYRLSLIPLGGYVRLWKEAPFIEDLDRNDPNFKDNFAARPIYQRFFVLIGGPLFNFLLAIILLAGLFYYLGQPVGASTVIDQVVAGLPAEKSGLVSGDEIIAVNGKKINSWEELVLRVQSHNGSELKVGVRRGENHLEFNIVPEIQEGRKLIGISPRVIRERLELIPAIKEGSRLTWVNSKEQFLGIIGLFTGRTSFKGAAGPIGILQMTNQAAQSGLESLVSLMIMINIAIGVFNLLPIPLLDGGWIAFLITEILRGKPLSKEKQIFLLNLGAMLLLTFAVFATYNDVNRIRNK